MTGLDLYLDSDQGEAGDTWEAGCGCGQDRGKDEDREG